MPLALDLESLPGLPGRAVPWLIAGALLAWLALRVWILRGRLARLEDGETAPSAPPWLAALARSRLSLPALLLGIVACAGAVVLAAS